jgi:cystathionine beta-lyase family protein involved in aluminum resistance
VKGYDYYAKIYGFDQKVIDFVSDAENNLSDIFNQVHTIGEANQIKVIRAFQDEGVSARHFNPSTGYGYSDDGRDKLSSLFARVFGAQSAIASACLVLFRHSAPTGYPSQCDRQPL